MGNFTYEIHNPLATVSHTIVGHRLNPACYAEDGTQVNCDYWSK